MPFAEQIHGVSVSLIYFNICGSRSSNALDIVLFIVMRILFAVQQKIENKHINKPIDSYKLLRTNFSTVSFDQTWMFGFFLRTLYLSNSIYCGMIGINDSSRFVVFVGSYSRTLQARQKQMKKEEQFGFFTQTENRRILEITSPRKSKKKPNKKNPKKLKIRPQRF